MKYVFKLAKAFESKVLENQLMVNPDVVVEEHEGAKPVSYMAFSNLKTVINDATELLSILNDEDDLPQWVDEMLAMSKGNISKALDYIRSEKIETESLLEDKDQDHELVAEAQSRGFLSSVKDVFNRPKTYGELQLIETDEELRRIFLNHGSSNTSLDQDLRLASEAINENNFPKARKHLIDFNNALVEMSDVAEEFLEIPDNRLNESLEKTAGFFDFFRSKEKPAPIPRDSSQMETFKKIKTLLGIAEHTLEQLKLIFEFLNEHRSNKNVNGYLYRLQLLKDEQRIFSEKFEKIKLNLEESGQEIIGKSLKEMKTHLYDPRAREKETEREKEFEKQKRRKIYLDLLKMHQERSPLSQAV